MGGWRFLDGLLESKDLCSSDVCSCSVRAAVLGRLIGESCCMSTAVLRLFQALSGMDLRVGEKI
jgi:hypothetical protein